MSNDPAGCQRDNIDRRVQKWKPQVAGIALAQQISAVRQSEERKLDLKSNKEVVCITTC